MGAQVCVGVCAQRGVCACVSLLLRKLTEGGLGDAVTSPWKWVLDLTSRAFPPSELVDMRKDVRGRRTLRGDPGGMPPSGGGSEAPSHFFHVIFLKSE